MRYHCLSQALNAGVNPAGGTSRAINIGTAGKGHGTQSLGVRAANALDQLEFKYDYQK